MTTENDKPSVNEVEFWESYYRKNDTPWDLNTYSPPLKSFLDSSDAIAPGKIAVIGSGKGNDCMLFADYGFEVTAIDFAPSAIALTRARFEEKGILGSKGKILHRDLFDLHDFDGQFDYVLEHTCFCAIHPKRRSTYIDAVRDLLKPDGKLIALFWLLDRWGGPPYGTTKKEILELFSPAFRVDIMREPADSIAARKGQELFTVMSRI